MLSMFQRPQNPNQSGRQPAVDRGDDARSDDLRDDGAARFAWEFGEEARRNPNPVGGRDAVHATRTTGGPHPRSDAGSPQARREAARIGEALTRSLDRWWAVAELPSPELLMDGLLLMEAGGDLPDALRVLLLRAALAHGRGWQTALRHRGDGELSALVVAEVLVIGPRSPVEDAFLDHIVGQADALATWRGEFLSALRSLARESRGEQRRRALALLDSLEARQAQRVVDGTDGRRHGLRTLPLRRLVLLTLFVGLIGFLIWERMPRTPQGMVQIPASSFALPTGAPDGPAYRQVTVAAFWIDRTEVTNRDYRRCVAQGGCLHPAGNSSATRPDYFIDPSFDEYPVVNVSQAAAIDYCTWLGKRLPTMDEWQVAAAADPVSGRATDYPWGQRMAVAAANSTALGTEDTLPVGSFRPVGDSPYGVSDMAGNVAEWTFTSDVSGAVVVKGGAFLDDPAALRTWAEVRLDPATTAPWLGFRCIQSPASGR